MGSILGRATTFELLFFFATRKCPSQGLSKFSFFALVGPIRRKIGKSLIDSRIIYNASSNKKAFMSFVPFSPLLLLPSHPPSFPGSTPGVRPSRKMKKLNWSKIDQSRVISTPNNVWRRLSASEDGVGPLSPGDQMRKTLEELFSQRELSRVNAFRKKSQTSEKKKVVGGGLCYDS